MAYIILPSRWTKQPTGLVELDYSNPLLNELVAGYSSMPTWYRMGSDLIRRMPANTPAGATTMPNNLTVQPSQWGPLFSRSFSTATPSMTVAQQLAAGHDCNLDHGIRPDQYDRRNVGCQPPPPV